MNQELIKDNNIEYGMLPFILLQPNEPNDQHL